MICNWPCCQRIRGLFRYWMSWSGLCLDTGESEWRMAEAELSSFWGLGGEKREREKRGGNSAEANQKR